MKRSGPSLLACLLISIAAAGCSRIELAYNQADFLLTRYADEYLGLTKGQLAAWEPRLGQVLAAHRREELPYLAAFAARMQMAARSGFPASESVCLVGNLRDLYRRHARLAIDLAAPLLAGLGPDQIQALDERFARDERRDRSEQDSRGTERERRKRARRWVKSIEDWTGELREDQHVLVAETTGRFPDSARSWLSYRAAKRTELLGRLRSAASQSELHGFLTAWLVDYRDLPPDLERAGAAFGEAVAGLLTELGGTLDRAQSERLDQRLSDLRDDLIRLQESPRLAPLGC